MKRHAVVGMLLVGAAVCQGAWILEPAPYGTWDAGYPGVYPGTGAVGLDAGNHYGQVLMTGSIVPGGEPNPYGGPPIPYMPNVAAVEIFPWNSEPAYTMGPVTLEIWKFYGANLTEKIHEETFPAFNVPAYNSVGHMLCLTTPVTTVALGGTTVNYAVIVKSNNGALWLSTANPYTYTGIGRILHNYNLGAATTDLAVRIYMGFPAPPAPGTVVVVR